MSVDPSQLSVGEIRRRFIQGDEPTSGQLLNKLRRDPRRGARQVYELLRRRQDRARAERLRLDSMLNFERVLWRSGLTRIAGVDEAGVGPLAGPVVAAAVVFPPGTAIPGVDDSKRIEPERREALAAEIREVASGFAVGLAQVGEIDRINVYHAGILAMRRAVEGLPEAPEHVLLDAREIPDLGIPQNRFDKGDGLDFSIAAASILAKTHRDRLMCELDRRFPEYGFAQHKGYGTAEHQAAIRDHGPCEIHRMSFPVIAELCGECSGLFYELRERLDAVEGRTGLAAFEDELAARRERLAEEEHRKLRVMVRRRWKTV